MRKEGNNIKKMMKLGKIFLLITTVFSYVASPISVLAEEVINREAFNHTKIY